MELQLYEGLPEQEVKSLSNEFSSKLHQRWKSKCEETDNIKSEYENYKTENGKPNVFTEVN